MPTAKTTNSVGSTVQLVEKHSDVWLYSNIKTATRFRYGLGRTDADRLVDLLEKFEIRFGGVTPGVVDDGVTSHAFIPRGAAWQPVPNSYT